MSEPRENDYVVPDASKATALDYLTRAAWVVSRAADECRSAADDPNTSDEDKANRIGASLALAHYRAMADIDSARRLIMFDRFGRLRAKEARTPGRDAGGQS